MHEMLQKIKSLFFLCGVVVCILTAAFVIAGQAPVKPAYSGNDLVFCNRILGDNYLIITRKHLPHLSPEFQYRLSYIVHSKGVYNTVLEKNLGEGVQSHIMSGTLTQNNDDRTNNLKISSDSDLFVWIEGQASYAYLFHATNSGIKLLFDIEGGNRGNYACQDIDGDGIFEIIVYDTTWHVIDDTTKRWAGSMRGHPFAKIVYKFNGAKYVLTEIVPDFVAEKEERKRK